MRTKRTWLPTLLVLALPLLLVTVPAAGKKPGSPPADADPAIAFESRGALWVMDEDGGNATRVLDMGAWHPSWSPDGHHLAFVDGLRRLYRVDIDVVNGVPRASNLTLLVEAATTMGSSRWSPEGDEILFTVVSPERLMVVPADGGEVTTLYVGNEASDSLGAGFPTWSPDGSEIAFRVDSLSGDTHVKILERSTLTVTAMLGPIGGEGMSLDWARTKDVIAWERYGQGTVNLLDLADGETTGVIEGRWPSWSPDDGSLVLKGDLGKNKEGAVKLDLATGTTELLLRDRYARFFDWRR